MEALHASLVGSIPVSFRILRWILVAASGWYMALVTGEGNM